jgi:hypothetical protein
LLSFIFVLFGRHAKIYSVVWIARANHASIRASFLLSVGATDQPIDPPDAVLTQMFGTATGADATAAADPEAALDGLLTAVACVLHFSLPFLL